MTRKTWSETDVSAYLDGELAPEVQVTFETAVTQDPDLQRRVAEMRQVVTLIRSVPLQEPPRNYLLTPAMVGESRPQPQRRRLPLLMMRIATSVAAAAFAVTAGLTLMQRNITPGMMTQSRDLPQAALMLEKDANDDTAEMLEVPMAQAVPPVEELVESEASATSGVEKSAELEIESAEAAAPEVPPLPTPSVQGTPTIEELRVSDAEEIPTAELGTRVEGENSTPEYGIGGGGEVSEPEAGTDGAGETLEGTAAPGMAAAMGVPESTGAPTEDVMQAEIEMAPAEMATTAEVAEYETMAMDAPLPPAEAAENMTTGDDSGAAIRMMPQDEEIPYMAGESVENAEITPNSTRVAPALWVPIGLGIVTAALAGITFRMSRRRLD